MRTMAITCSLSFMMLCSSCATYRIPDAGEAASDTPDAFSSQDGSAGQLDHWWRAFDSDELDRLLGLTLTNSTSLAQAEAKLRQVRALAVKSSSAKLPEISLSGAVSSTERETPLVEGGDTRSEAAELKLAASYELDLWGRVRATTLSARLEGDAALEDLRAARISVTSEAALLYLELLSVRQKLDVIRAQVKTNETILELVELRFKRAQATALDVLQQRESLAGVQALVAPLEAREMIILNALAVMSGLPSGSDLRLEARALPDLPEMPATGLPVELLSRRPDVRAARMRLDSSQWKVNAAQADRLPALRLTGSYGYSSQDIGSLLDNWAAQLAAGLLGPLVDGGRRRAEVRRAEAVVDQWLATYRGVVLDSIREVEDSLVQERKQDEYLDALERQYRAAVMSREEATSRYRNGSESYLSVLASLSSGQRLERQLIDASLNRLKYRVQLYRALAGGWDNFVKDEGKADSQ